MNYNADVPLVFSEIDPIQNAAVTAAVNTVGFSETSTHGLSSSGPIQNINVINGGAGYTAGPRRHDFWRRHPLGTRRGSRGHRHRFDQPDVPPGDRNRSG